MAKNKITLFFILVISICILISNVTGQEIKEFSADQVHLDSKGKIKNTWKFYKSINKIRFEMNTPWGKGKMVNIILEDKKINYTIFPEKKVYVQNVLKDEDLQTFQQFNKGNLKEKKLGVEKVNGYKCTKKQVETTNNIMGMKMKIKMVIWSSSKFPMPLRTKTEKGEISEIRNIKIGRQSAKLFKVPAGYKKAASMMEVMSGSMGRRK